MLFLQLTGSVCSAEDVYWGRLQQHRAMNGGVKIHFFVNEENSAKLRMVALCGELGNFEPNLADTGIVMSKNEMINPYNDDACYQIEVLGKTGMSEYYVKYEDGQALKKNMFIEFNGNVMLNDGYIKIISMNDMSGPMSTWNFTLTKYAGLFVGQVANVDGQLLFFKDGTAGTIHKSETYIILDHGVNTTKSRFELATKDKIISGNRCVYTLGDSIKTLIVEDIY